MFPTITLAGPNIGVKLVANGAKFFAPMLLSQIHSSLSLVCLIREFLYNHDHCLLPDRSRSTQPAGSVKQLEFG